MQIENRCCDCDQERFPCMGDCSKTHEEVYYCDRCNEEIDGDVYGDEDEDLCLECLKEAFRKYSF